MRVSETTSDLPIVDYLAGYLRFLGAEPAGPGSVALTNAIAHATNAAGRVRDRLSPDGWAAIAELERAAQTQAPARPGAGAVTQRTAMLRLITGFAGLVHENMYRNLGWRFLSLGRSIERAMATASMLASLTDEKAPEGALEAALECADSALSYRRAYSFLITRETVLEFVGFDGDNPRSLSSLLNDMLTHVKALPGADVRGALSAPNALALRIHTGFAVRKPDTIGPGGAAQPARRSGRAL